MMGVVPEDAAAATGGGKADKIRRSSVMSELRVLHTACQEITLTCAVTQKVLPVLRAGSDIGSDVHDIAMVLASFDRCLFYFVCDELLAPSSRAILENESSLKHAVRLSVCQPRATLGNLSCRVGWHRACICCLA